jgi:murein DD-endopeptidase MepM/ murein hydrolase activator NlpD
VRTGRTISVRWPAGASLGAGSYHVRVIAHDRRGVSLLRTSGAPGVASLTVLAPAPPLVPSVPAQASAVEAGVPTPAATLAFAPVFPVAGPHSFGGPENRFGAPRGSHFHEGQDVLTAEGTPVLAPLAGTVAYVSYQEGGAGYYTVEHTTVGFDLMFAHCQAGSLAVAVGEAVAAGSLLCHAGMTGDATGPHLHFEMWVGGWQAAGGHAIDPLPYLEAWEATAG